MGIFSPNYNRPGPGVDKNAPQKKGFARFFELVSRDMGDLFKMNVIFAAVSLPMIAAAYFMMVSFSVEPFYLIMPIIGYVAFVLFSIPLSPTIAAIHSIITHMLRDEPIYMWHEFKKSFKTNFKQSAGVGTIFFALMGMELFAVRLYLKNMELGVEMKLNVVLLAIFFFNLLLAVLISLYAFLQLIYMDLKVFPIIKNSLLLTFAMAKRSLPAAIWVIGLSAVVLLFIPPQIGFVLYLAFVPILILLVADMWLWPTMEKTFHISDLLEERRNTQALESTEEKPEV